ncbi:SDR family NAD(P)-dependent oxidoreductase [Sphingomonas sp. 1P08PE]|uniref:SDR family NAD(P)-dependent oxidoreductase n=1 Tax=Sphingomonas sp. 1P08PE TaxID=554122 RepID=UPI00399FAA8F
MIFARDAFEGRHFLVTGASSGLGQHTAIRLAEAGARVALVGRSPERLATTVASLAGGGHSTHSADLSDAETTADLVQAIAREQGSFAGIFHSAGTALILPARVTKNRHLDDVFAAGVRGAFGVARAAAKKGVVVDGGSLVFMSSVSSMRGRPGMSAYSAAKAAVDGMVRVLASEMADRKIRVNSIVAGGIETAMHRDFTETVSDELVRNYEALHMLSFGQPDDIAYAAMFLLSDASRWITGSNMVVDGGYTAK